LLGWEGVMRISLVQIAPLLIVVLTACISTAHPGAIVLSGTQEEQVVTLIASAQPYIIRGDYYVPAGKRLEIEEGASFVAEKDAAMSVAGTLAISGTKEKPVTFRGKATGKSYWKGIALQEAEAANMDFVHVEGAAIAVYVFKCKPEIRGCVITRNTLGIHNKTTRCLIENCTITDNAEDGIFTYLSVIEISSSTITRNGGFGIRGEYGGSVQVERSLVLDNGKGGVGGQYDSETYAHHSVFGKNGEYDVVVSSLADWDFSQNWWGETATKLLISKGDTTNLPNIHDGHDEEDTGKVRLHSFLREMPKNCGAFAGDQENAETAGAQQAGTSKGTAITFTRDCYIITRPEDYYPFHVALANGDMAEVQRYVNAGQVFLVKSGTKGLAVTARGLVCGIHVLDGPNKGKEGWVYRKNVVAE
jgi:hypothetical protein